MTSHWKDTHIGAITSKVGSGVTPRGGTKAYVAEGVPLIRSQNVHFDGIHWDGLAFITQSCADVIMAVIREGDILLNITGASIGRVCRAPESLDGARVNQHVTIIRTSPYFSARFLGRFLASPVFQQRIHSDNYGVTRPALTKQQIVDFEIPVPPLKEQERIADKIDALFAHSAKAKAALDRIPALLDKLKRSILAAAFSGELTKDWRAAHPDVEPADQLLARIRAERRRRWEEAELEKMRAKGKEPKNDKWKAKYKEPSGSATEVGGMGLPSTWGIATMGAVCLERLAIGPFGSDLKVSDYRSSGVPLVFVKNIRNADFRAIKYISHAKAIALQAHDVQPGDVMVTKMGDPPGEAAVYPGGASPGIITSDCIRIRPNRLLIGPGFLSASFESELVKRQVAEASTGVAQQKMSLKRFEPISLLIPPRIEQEELYRQIRTLSDVVAVFLTRTRQAKTWLNDLDQSILAKAFRGELVPQDPTDEPASVLLKRIQAERATAPQEAEESRRKRRATEP